MAYKPENTLTHNFVNCIKHEMKYNFLFIEYVNLIEIINIIKTETKRGEQKDTWKYEGRNLQKKNQQRDPNHWCHH